MIAGAAMAMSSVSVVSNSLRLRGKRIQSIQPIKTTEHMKKEFQVEGMMCNHCRMHVEKALNKVEGVQATVTLNPPVATVEFLNGEVSKDTLQKALDEAGEYRLSGEYIAVHFQFHCSENPNALQWNPNFTAVRCLGKAFHLFDFL